MQAFRFFLALGRPAGRIATAFASVARRILASWIQTIETFDFLFSFAPLLHSIDIRLPHSMHVTNPVLTQAEHLKFSCPPNFRNCLRVQDWGFVSAAWTYHAFWVPAGFAGCASRIGTLRMHTIQAFRLVVMYVLLLSFACRKIRLWMLLLRLTSPAFPLVSTC